ncbi:COP9 signalosome complex subunit 8 [Gossypium australe]|uniref:COP9 signalosome complex subunit 8 n=1 Tax=Gossypium australe TaxID=47621 RepID=A0A5B6VIX9_9ROSI|nr:COP9 signalosome complex subunit 8 [Gossypium australe]
MIQTQWYDTIAMKRDALQRGWIIDPASQMLIVTKQCIVKEQKLDPSKLQRLTEYVFHLEH